MSIELVLKKVQQIVNTNNNKQSGKAKMYIPTNAVKNCGIIY